MSENLNPAPVQHSRVIAGVTVDVLLDQCERLAGPIRASTKSFQYASALDNCVAVIKALRGTHPTPETKDCPACGGTGRMGPFFPGGVSTVCGNCTDPSPQPRETTPDALAAKDAEIERLRVALVPFRLVAGRLFETNANASDTVFEGPHVPHMPARDLTAGDFFAVASAVDGESDHV
jgi:hypothetical protein